MGDSIRDLLFTNKTQFSIKSDLRNFVMRMKLSAISTLIWLTKLFVMFLQEAFREHSTTM